MEYHYSFITHKDYDYYSESISKKKYQFYFKLDVELGKNRIGK